MKPLPMNEIITRDEYEARVQTVKGIVFLHLDVWDWSKATLYKVRKELDDYLIKAERYGHDVIFMASDSPKSVKMWQMVKPCFTTQEVKQGSKTVYLGSWITGEDDGS